jgi:hypothetical protein
MDVLLPLDEIDAPASIRRRQDAWESVEDRIGALTSPHVAVRAPFLASVRIFRPVLSLEKFLLAASRVVLLTHLEANDLIEGLAVSIEVGVDVNLRTFPGLPRSVNIVWEEIFHLQT